jgi:hypothetical protein
MQLGRNIYKHNPIKELMNQKILDKKLENWINRNFYQQPIECFETLKFKELCIGEMFISLPLPGDNNGHGGFLSTHYLFRKTSDEYFFEDNAERVEDGTIIYMSAGMPVIKIE